MATLPVLPGAISTAAAALGAASTLAAANALATATAAASQAINGGGAFFGNPSITAQGIKAGATQVVSAAIPAAVATTAAPPKANAAPSVSKNAVIGLMDALNAAEVQLCIVPKGQTESIFKIPNTYSVEFAPASLGNTLVTKSGSPNKAKTPMQQSVNPSDKVNPKSNSAAYNVRTFSIAAGRSIVSVIDEILKNSSFIADQSAYIIDENTQQTIPQTSLGNLVWYKISVVTTPGDVFDDKRGDFAYNIKYVISAYAINNMRSQYFLEGAIRGVHKSYKYWFTGQNTQVLRFAQDYNSAYLTTIDNKNAPFNSKKQQTRLNREARGFQVQAAVGSSSSQGAEGQANSIGASAADYLYSPTDIAEITINIIGDPAWLQQGEMATGVTSLNFNFKPFNADGGINFDASEVTFDFQWNTVSDYDAENTGLATPIRTGADNTQIYTYKASEISSKFLRGKFEQELKGSLIRLDTTPAVTSANTNANANGGTVDEQTAINAAISAARTSSTSEWNNDKIITLGLPTSTTLTGAVAKGVNQILTPAPITGSPTLTQLTGSVAYINARLRGVTAEAALELAKLSFASTVAPAVTSNGESVGIGLPQPAVEAPFVPLLVLQRDE